MAQPKKKAPARKARGKKGAAITPEQRWRMISEAAYFLAEKRGFVGGDVAHDWLQAEAEIDAALARKK